MIGKKMVILALSLGLFGTVASINTGKNASAKAAPAKLIKKTNIKNSAVHFTKHADNVSPYLYATTSLTKKVTQQSLYVEDTFIKTTKAQVLRNGKKYTYDYIVSTDGFIKGWIRSDYLAAGKDKRVTWYKKAGLASAKKLPSDIKLKKNSVKESDNVSGRDPFQTYARMTNGHKVYWNLKHPQKALEVMPKLYPLSDKYTNHTKHWKAYYVLDKGYLDNWDDWDGSTYHDFSEEYQDSNGGFSTIAFTGGRGTFTYLSYSKKIMLICQNNAIDNSWGDGAFSPVSHYAK